MSTAMTTRMLVLGVVSIFEPANGYQIRRELQSWHVEEWSSLNPGSIYSMLTTLAKQRLVTRHDLVDGGRPVAVYSLSEEGRVEYGRLVRSGLDGSGGLGLDVFQTAMSFMTSLARAEVLELLSRRQERMDGLRADLVDKVSAGTALIPPHVSHALTLEVSVLDATRTWLKDFRALLEGGFLVFVGEPGAWAPPDDDSGWEMVEQGRRYRELIGAQRS